MRATRVGRMIASMTIRGRARCIRMHSERWQRQGRSFLTGVSAGATLAYLLDPERGRHRRHLVRERSAGTIRHGARRLGHGSRVAALQTIGHAKGALHRLWPPPAGEPLDDAGLAHKVESVVFRDPRVPKGEISINAESGTVFLRGQLESAELIDDVGKAVRKIRDVEKVVNLLHLPGTEAPHPAGHPLTRSVR